MGKNKLKKFAEMASYPHVFEADYKDLEGEYHSMRGLWRKDFFKNDAPLILELGCGKGEYTVKLAELFPEKNFIGIDIKGSRMHKGASIAYQNRLSNVAFLRTRIEFITSFFCQNEVDEIWLTFPDPQIKKVSKRLTSTTFMKLYGKIMKPNSKIHIKTDSLFLYTYTKEMTKLNRLTVKIDESDLYNSSYYDKVLQIKTYYEEKWINHGLSIKYLQLLLSDISNWQEPDVDIEPDNYHSAGRGIKIREMS